MCMRKRICICMCMCVRICTCACTGLHPSGRIGRGLGTRQDLQGHGVCASLPVGGHRRGLDGVPLYSSVCCPALQTLLSDVHKSSASNASACLLQCTYCTWRPWPLDTPCPAARTDSARVLLGFAGPRSRMVCSRPHAAWSTGACLVVADALPPLTVPIFAPSW